MSFCGGQVHPLKPKHSRWGGCEFHKALSTFEPTSEEENLALPGSFADPLCEVSLSMVCFVIVVVCVYNFTK